MNTDTVNHTTMHEEDLLRVESLTVAYGKIIALEEVTLHILKGEIVTLIGSNGAGKSTLMSSIMGDPKPRSGRVYFEKRDITHCSPYEKARLRLALCPEGRHIFMNMTVKENLLVAAEMDRRRYLDVDLEKVFSFFPKLKDRFYQTAGTMSGGEQQMLAIARALMTRPRILFLDEPSLGLAPIITQQIFESISRLNQEEGLTIFVVEQNAFLAMQTSHRTYLLVNGKIMSQGLSKDLIKDPHIISAYLEGH